MESILPLGSVVTLKEGKVRLMIAGRYQKEASEDSERIFDYAAVLWPIGSLSSSKLYLFDNEDIETVWFIGLQDSQEFEFRHFLTGEKQKHDSRTTHPAENSSD